MDSATGYHDAWFKEVERGAGMTDYARYNVSTGGTDRTVLETEARNTAAAAKVAAELLQISQHKKQKSNKVVHESSDLDVDFKGVNKSKPLSHHEKHLKNEK